MENAGYEPRNAKVLLDFLAIELPKIYQQALRNDIDNKKMTQKRTDEKKLKLQSELKQL